MNTNDCSFEGRKRTADSDLIHNSCPGAELYPTNTCAIIVVRQLYGVYPERGGRKIGIRSVMGKGRPKQRNANVNKIMTIFCLFGVL